MSCLLVTYKYITIYPQMRKERELHGFHDVLLDVFNFISFHCYACIVPMSCRTSRATKFALDCRLLSVNGGFSKSPKSYNNPQLASFLSIRPVVFL